MTLVNIQKAANTQKKRHKTIYWLLILAWQIAKKSLFFSFVLIIEHASNCEKLAYFLKLTDFPIMLLGQAQNCGLSDNSSNLRNKSTAFSEKSWLISCLICQSSTNVFWKVLCAAYKPLLFIVFMSANTFLNVCLWLCMKKCWFALCKYHITKT